MRTVRRKVRIDDKVFEVVTYCMKSQLYVYCTTALLFAINIYAIFTCTLHEKGNPDIHEHIIDWIVDFLSEVSDKGAVIFLIVAIAVCSVSLMDELLKLLTGSEIKIET